MHKMGKSRPFVLQVEHTNIKILYFFCSLSLFLSRSLFLFFSLFLSFYVRACVWSSGQMCVRLYVHVFGCFTAFVNLNTKEYVACFLISDEGNVFAFFAFFELCVFRDLVQLRAKDRESADRTEDISSGSVKVGVESEPADDYQKTF